MVRACFETSWREGWTRSVPGSSWSTAPRPCVRRSERSSEAWGVVQRCQIHKRRNILGHLPDGMQASVKAILSEAWSLHDGKLARARLERLASSLEADHPGAAASVREGLEEALTLQGLGIDGTLYRKRRSTNAIENLKSGIAHCSRNVKRWQGGSMVVRWVSAAIVEAEKKFRRVQGWRDIEKLVRTLALLEAKEEATAERVA